LVHFKQVDGRGIELSQDGVNACVRNGLSVVHGDADTDLRDYPTNGFDMVVLSQTLQAVHDPRGVLLELVRIGRRAVVSFPNFGFWQIRWKLLLGGRMPVTGNLDQLWYETPNIHLCTVRDFVTLCGALGITIERSIALNRRGAVWPFGATGWLANMLSEQAVFLLSRSSN
jgi:methionine biosynthesis protein MetW